MLSPFNSDLHTPVQYQKTSCIEIGDAAWRSMAQHGAAKSCGPNIPGMALRVPPSSDPDYQERKLKMKQDP